MHLWLASHACHAVNDIQLMHWTPLHTLNAEWLAFKASREVPALPSCFLMSLLSLPALCTRMRLQHKEHARMWTADPI